MAFEASPRHALTEKRKALLMAVAEASMAVGGGFVSTHDVRRELAWMRSVPAVYSHLCWAEGAGLVRSCKSGRLRLWEPTELGRTLATEAWIEALG